MPKHYGNMDGKSKKYDNLDGTSGSSGGGRKSASKYKGMGKTRTKKTTQGMKYGSDGPGDPAGKPGNPKTGMGVKSGKATKLAQGGVPGAAAAGLARTRKGINQTGSGPQGMHG